MEPLRVGIIGVGGFGRTVLNELVGNESLVLKAIADQSMELAKELADEYKVNPYDDYRQLMVQEDLDVVFIILPNYLAEDCVKLAAKEGMHVFKESPVGRMLPESMQAIEAMNKAGKQYHIGAHYRFAPGFLHAHKKLGEGAIGSVYLVRAESFGRFPDPISWRGDPVLAGGGVLLEQGYPLIDQIVWNFGPPERLYSLNTSFCSKRALPPSRTEDTAVVTMKFPDGSVGNLTCSWTTGEQDDRLIMYGTEGVLDVTATSCKLFDGQGELLEEETYDVDMAWMVSQQIRQFADSLLDSELKPVSTAEEHLPNIAIIESAYLSGRTQLPESLRVYGSLFKM